VRRLIGSLHPWTSYLIVPIFALANAGIELSPDAAAASTRVLVGVTIALVAGKLTGVAAFSWIAVRFGFGRLPDGARWRPIVGVGAIAGFGFTVSLFITGLAFDTGSMLAAPGAASSSRWAYQLPRSATTTDLVTRSSDRDSSVAAD
jgi:NhaA family Na+:H+ antiporter